MFHLKKMVAKVLFSVNSSVNDRQNSGRAYKPAYSLWYLETHPRKLWLQTVLVILYKVICLRFSF